MAETLRFSEVFAGTAGEVMPLAIRVGDAVYSWRISGLGPAAAKAPASRSSNADGASYQEHASCPRCSWAECGQRGSSHGLHPRSR